MIPAQDPHLPAKLPHVVGAMNLVGARGLCFHRAVGLVLDIPPPKVAELVIGRIREATIEELEAAGDRAPELSPTPFIHAWVEWQGLVWAPTLIETMGGLFPVDRAAYLERNGAVELARVSRGTLKRLDRLHGYSAHLLGGSKGFKPLKAGVTFGGSLLDAVGVGWKDNGLGGVVPLDVEV